jgi:hypothetical protein
MTVDNKSTEAVATEDESGTPIETPEQRQDKKLSQEAAKWRTQLRTSEKAREELAAKVEALEGKVKSGGSSTSGDENPSELARMKRDLESLQEKLATSEKASVALSEKVRSKTLKAALSQVIASSNIIDPAAALELLEKRAKIADDDTAVFVVRDPETGETREVEATVENLTKFKLLSSIFFKAEGVSGSGGRGSTGLTGNGQDIVAKGLADPSFFQKNKDAIMAKLKQQG